MIDLKKHLQLALDMSHSDVTDAIFKSVLLERGEAGLRHDDWATSARTLDALGPPVFRSSSDVGESALYDFDGVLTTVGLFSGRVSLQAASSDGNALDRVVADLKAKLPAPDPTSAHEVTVTFWTYSPHGPTPSWRSIAVPSWDDIEHNYAGATRGGLAAIMVDFQPAHGGQLILWHGNAGTGKTFGLRALAWEWRDWCDFHYIVDPDSFFGEHADYLMSVLLQPEYVAMGTPSMHGFIPGGYQHVFGDEDDENGGDRSKGWRVLVLEDTGELLAADARVAAGQGLSRFLNVVDGLIGQGLRVLVLVTTNEPIRKLHPAVARPGRCAANIEFLPLDRDEATAWLAAHGHEEAAGHAMTLAELYARAAGLEPGELAPLVGFADGA